jgi:hypothetical protein
MPTDELEVVGSRSVFDAASGRTYFVPVTRAKTRRFRPGETVTLPQSELARLRGLGFIVDERRIAKLSAAELKKL